MHYILRLHTYLTCKIATATTSPSTGRCNVFFFHIGSCKYQVLIAMQNIMHPRPCRQGTLMAQLDLPNLFPLARTRKKMFITVFQDNQPSINLLILQNTKMLCNSKQASYNCLLCDNSTELSIPMEIPSQVLTVSQLVMNPYTVLVVLSLLFKGIIHKAAEL